MDTNNDSDLMKSKYGHIRDVLNSQCSKEEFQSLKCPRCGGDLMLELHLDGKEFFVKCPDDTTHLAMHGENESPPDWFEEMPHTGWY